MSIRLTRFGWREPNAPLPASDAGAGPSRRPSRQPMASLALQIFEQLGTMAGVVELLLAHEGDVVARRIAYDMLAEYREWEHQLGETK